jgi:hypothetical protein
MFTRDELIAHAWLPGDEEDPPLVEVAEFHRHQFKSGGKGIHGPMVAHRGDMDDFPSALVFWLWSLQLVDRPTTSQGFYRLAREALCEPLSEEAYFQTIGRSLSGLKRPAPAFLRRGDGVVAALKMYGGVVLADFFHSVLAEFDDCYVAFHFRIRGC